MSNVSLYLGNFFFHLFYCIGADVNFVYKDPKWTETDYEFIGGSLLMMSIAGNHQGNVMVLLQHPDIGMFKAVIYTQLNFFSFLLAFSSN